MSLIPNEQGNPPSNPPTAPQSLLTTLGIGNITGPQDIVVSNTQKVDYAGNIRLKNNTGGGGTDVIIDSIPLNTGPLLTQGVFYDTATNRLLHQNQINENLATTLAIGNATGANDISVNNGQKISFQGDIVLQCDAGGFGDDMVVNLPLSLVDLPEALAFDTATNKIYHQPRPVFNAGAGITLTGPLQNRTITNSGVVQLTAANAGANITIAGTPSVPIISATASPSALTSWAGFPGTPVWNTLSPLPIVAGAYYLPFPTVFTSIIQGNSGYPAIPTTEDLFITCYVSNPFQGVNKAGGWYICLGYWNGSQWLPAGSAVGLSQAFYSSARGGTIDSGGTISNSFDSVLYGWCPSVGGQVRFTILLIQDNNTQYDMTIQLFNTIMSFFAVPITNLH